MYRYVFFFMKCIHHTFYNEKEGPRHQTSSWAPQFLAPALPKAKLGASQFTNYESTRNLSERAAARAVAALHSNNSVFLCEVSSVKKRRIKYQKSHFMTSTKRRNPISFDSSNEQKHFLFIFLLLRSFYPVKKPVLQFVSQK